MDGPPEPPGSDPQDAPVVSKLILTLAPFLALVALLLLHVWLTR